MLSVVDCESEAVRRRITVTGYFRVVLFLNKEVDVREEFQQLCVEGLLESSRGRLRGRLPCWAMQNRADSFRASAVEAAEWQIVLPPLLVSQTCPECRAIFFLWPGALNQLCTRHTNQQAHTRTHQTSSCMLSCRCTIFFHCDPNVTKVYMTDP